MEEQELIQQEKIDEQDKSYQLKKVHKTAVVVGIAIVASLFMYPVIVEILKTYNAPFKGFGSLSESDLNIIKYVFLGLAILEYPFVIFITGRILAIKKSFNRSTEDSSFSSSVQRLFLTSIISYACFEAIAIMGLVLFLLGGRSVDFYTFLALSLIYFVLDFPKYNQWEEYVKNLR